MGVQVELSKDLARHLRAGHPWVFRKALKQPPRMPAGTIVDVAENGRFVARGYYDPLSPIAVRVLTRDEREPIDRSFWKRRVADSLKLRRELLDLSHTDSFRLLHGESDMLPGVNADLYAGFAVLKLYSAGLTPHREAIVAALRDNVPDLLGVLGRDELSRDDAEDESDRPAQGRPLWGKPPPQKLCMTENGMKLWLDPYTGQKTGMFLDQRDNRRLVRDLAKNRSSALNMFCYTGGFSVAAALGGAKRVVSVDSDADAVALCRENFELNELGPANHEFVADDAFKVLDRYKAEGRRFELIVLDPPAFAKSQRTVEAALDGYASLNRAALALLSPGGLLCTASCSARVSAEDFFTAVKEAAFKARVDLQLVHQRFQPPDHPVLAQFPQGRYLKFFVFRRPGGV
ncbi:MAG: class I SAM-dependent rRNA methyltransferase [Deltaproteobacteria bacterium]|nr:class I SAM-dependent rRNA methyltransferase [Deltaproteobacteria bacterium]